MLLVFIIYCNAARATPRSTRLTRYSNFFRVIIRKTNRVFNLQLRDCRVYKEETLSADIPFNRLCFLLRRNKEAAESEAIEAQGKTESAGKEDAFDANGEYDRVFVIHLP